MQLGTELKGKFLSKTFWNFAEVEPGVDVVHQSYSSRENKTAAGDIVEFVIELNTEDKIKGSIKA